MKSNQNNSDSSKGIVNNIKPIQQIETIGNLNYLSPNVHHLANQVRWFKGSRNRGFKSNIAVSKKYQIPINYL